MPYFDFMWTDEIIEHIADHGLITLDFEHVVCNPTEQTASRSSGRPAAWGYTEDGRFIIAIYELIDVATVLPVTAYEVNEE